ncbi:MAG TPA: cellulase family glycosylhydrolase [Micromonosporaceae bacterium]|nr:cellulase family glycosylhydrolase [Micromonosporaceae bacterium]
MTKRFAVAAAGLLALVASIFVVIQPAHAAASFSISNGRILDANGQDFVMRGVSHPYAWYPTQNRAFADISALGANTVRVVLGSGTLFTRSTPEQVTEVINQCKEHQLICVLEVHDTTGLGDQNAATLDQAADYWISLRDVLAGQEPYVIVNIGNEPIGNTNAIRWIGDTTAAIRKLRSAGLTHTLMVDAPNWGQDWTFTMRDNAAAVFASDTLRNTIFSVHMYGVFDTAAEVNAYLNHFVNAGLPLVVGEFGFDHSDGNPDENTIMATAQSLGLGYIGWSWSGNGGGVEYLDMATGFNPSALTSWGQRIFNGANGIRATSRRASVYPIGNSTTPPRTTAPPRTTEPPLTEGPPLTTAPPVGGGGGACTATYTVQNQWPGGFQGEVRITAGGSAISGWTVTWTYANGQTVSSSWSAALTTSGSTVTARNVAYNGSIAAGASTSFGFIGAWNGSNGPVSATCTAG